MRHGCDGLMTALEGREALSRLRDMTPWPYTRTDDLMKLLDRVAELNAFWIALHISSDSYLTKRGAGGCLYLYE